MRKYYFAYGSNLNKNHMKFRCPDAKYVDSYILKDYKLVFRSVADIEKAPGHEVHGAVYYITPNCEKALNRYEGYPHLYTKEFFTYKGRDLMTYSMVDKDLEYPPNQGYFETIFQGYQDWNLPLETLKNSLII